MKISRSILFLFALLLFACTEKAVQRSSPELFAKKLAMPFNLSKADPSVSLKFVRDEVRKTILERQKTIVENKMDLTYYYLAPQFLSNLGKVDPSIKYEGYWLKFEENNTFKYGIYDDIIGSGIYHYNPVSELLIMLDDDEQVEPKMWSFKYNSEFANLLGHPFIIKQANGVPYVIMKNWADTPYLDTLGKSLAEVHNGMQLKMILYEQQPSRG